MTDLNIDKLENEAMARAYDTSKPDELTKNFKDIVLDKDNISFFKISQLINKDIEVVNKKSLQSFRYIKMIDCEWMCHFVLLINNKLGVLIPSQYNIVYNASLNNDLSKGIIKFESEKEFQLEYESLTKDEFLSRMEELKVVSNCIETFDVNEQIFYEFDDGYIYMYYNEYIWKISNFSRNDIKEYYDMYLILLSIKKINNKHYSDKKNFKFLYLISKNCLDYLYKGIDLKKQNLEKLTTYYLSEDVVTFSIDNERYLTILDEDYQIFLHKKKNKTEVLEPLRVYCEEKWCFEGTFISGILGTYNFGYLLDFSEIVDSNELSEIEKRGLLENIIKQKQVELSEYKDIIRKKILNILMERLRTKLTFDIWNDLELVNYLNVENIEIENKTEELLYDFYKFALDNNDLDVINKTFDMDYLSKKIIPLKIIIGSEFLAFSCNIFNENKIFILFDNNELIEWK